MKISAPVFVMILIGQMALFTSCKKDNVEVEIDCVNFHIALEDENDTEVKALLDPILEQYNPDRNSTDETGHEENLKAIIEFLENVCTDLSIEYCYACLESLPLQSRLSIDLGDGQTKGLDLWTPDDGPMSVRSVY